MRGLRSNEGEERRKTATAFGRLELINRLFVATLPLATIRKQSVLKSGQGALT
jgi:hypothetical protein